MTSEDDDYPVPKTLDAALAAAEHTAAYAKAMKTARTMIEDGFDRVEAMTDNAHQFFDVDAVSIKTGARRKLAVAQTKDNAEAILRMAVARRGVVEECYQVVPHPESTS
jgi:hypothetical protein